MSIFAGFATRKQQQKYSNQIIALVTLLQQKILQMQDSIIQNKLFKQQFRTKLSKIVIQMQQLEKTKNFPLKVSSLVSQLLQKTQIKSNDNQQVKIHSIKNSEPYREKAKIITSRGNFVRAKSNSKKKIESGYQQNSEIFHLQNLQMQQILKRRPELPRRTIPFKQKKSIQFGNIQVIEQFQEQQLDLKQFKDNRTQMKRFQKTLEIKKNESNSLNNYYHLIRNKKY